MAMKSRNLSLALSAALAASTMIAGSTASAEDLPQTKAQQQFSVTQGFKETSLAVLQRTGNVDQKQVSQRLIEGLHPGSAYQSKQIGSRLIISGDQWALEVTADGSGADYQDSAVEARAHSLGKSPSQEMSAAELEQKGRAFIAEKLSSEIALGADEALVAVRADYRVEGGQDAKTGETSQAVVANRIVFGRTLHGVPVVGNGSRIVITFINDGSLESFRYDWPKYQAAENQNLVDAGEILARVQQVIVGRNGVAAATQGVSVPSGAAEAYPVALTPNTQLQKLECGYFDAGSFGMRSLAAVQPACMYHAVSQDGNGSRQGYAGAVPAGAQFEPDSAWMESQLLRPRK